MTDPLPQYLQGESAVVIEQRMVATALGEFPEISVEVGSPLRLAIRAAAVEFARAGGWMDGAIKRGFPMDESSVGIPDAYLDARGIERNIERIAAVAAKGPVSFTGTNGTVIPVGTRFATGSVPGSVPQIAQTDAQVTISGGVAATTGTNGTPGAAGNVIPGAFISLIDPVPGVSSVTNAAAWTGGVDEESNEEYAERYRENVKEPEGGGNQADYKRWARESSADVGGASVVINRDGPGTVSVAIIDTNNDPATQALVDIAQDYIAPPWEFVREAESAPLVVGGSGTSIATGLSDDSGDSVLMAYNATSHGTIRLPLLHTAIPLPQPGIWQVRPRIKVSSLAGSQNLLTIGIWNNTIANWAKTSPSAADGTAVRTLRGQDLALAFEELLALVNFYWNGSNSLELRIDRLNTGGGNDTTTNVWVDQITFRSTMSQDQAVAKAPAGANVTVEPATSVATTITGTVTVASGYDAAAVRAAAEANVIAYVKSLAFATNNDVTISGVQSALLATPGVVDYASVQINGVPANLVITAQQVAVATPASVTIS